MGIILNKQIIASNGMSTSVYDTNDKKTDIFNYVDDAIATIPTPDVSGQIETHNVDGIAHPDIREALDNHTHSWNDLEDKPFGELDQEESDFFLSVSYPVGASTMAALDGPWEAGTYRIYADGVRYPDVTVFVGTRNIGTDQNFPFYFSRHQTGPNPTTDCAWTVTFTDKSVEHNISVYKITKVLKTIDEKYLPNTVATKIYVGDQINTLKNDLLNGAGEAYDTLKELGDLIDENHDAIDALEIVATGKADKSYVDNQIANITPLIVTATDDIADKTFLEMLEVYENGGLVLLNYNDGTYVLNGFGTNEMQHSVGDGMYEVRYSWIAMFTSIMSSQITSIKIAGQSYRASKEEAKNVYGKISTTTNTLITSGGGRVTGYLYSSKDPISDSSVANKKYVDTSIQTAIGAALPAVTTDDNGKFLRVVNGVAAWATIPNAEEVRY